jgi:uncharacterized protein (DUF2236 family)
VLRFFGIQVKDERWLKNLGLIFIAVIVGSSVIISTNALLILAVRKNPLVYDLLYQLNAAFARVHHKMAALTAVGIFDPLIMQMLNRQFETLRAGSNSHLLGAMRRIEERDRERFSQPPNELNP